MLRSYKNKSTKSALILYLMLHYSFLKRSLIWVQCLKSLKNLSTGWKEIFQRFKNSLLIKYTRQYWSNILGILESFCKHPKILEISKLYAEFFLISAAIRLRGSPGVDGFQLKKNPDLANLLKYHTQQNIACGKFYLEQILSLRKLVAMAL